VLRERNGSDAPPIEDRFSDIVFEGRGGVRYEITLSDCFVIRLG